MKRNNKKKTKGAEKSAPSCPECPTKFCRYSVFTDKKYIRITLDKVKELYDEAEKADSALKIVFGLIIDKNEVFIIEGLVTKERRN